MRTGHPAPPTPRSRTCPSERLSITHVNRAPVDEGFTVQTEDAVLVRDGRLEADNRLVLADGEDFDFTGDRVADADGVAEVPVDIEEDTPRPRQIVRDDGVEDAGDDA